MSIRHLCRRGVGFHRKSVYSVLSPHMLHTLVLSLAMASRMSLPPQQPDSVRPDIDVRLAALRHAGDIQRCHETQGLRVNPGLGGSIEDKDTVGPSGRSEDVAGSASNSCGAGSHDVAK